jgi:hypothetical protein
MLILTVSRVYLAYGIEENDIKYAYVQKILLKNAFETRLKHGVDEQ